VVARHFTVLLGCGLDLVKTSTWVGDRDAILYGWKCQEAGSGSRRRDVTARCGGATLWATYERMYGRFGVSSHYERIKSGRPDFEFLYLVFRFIFLLEPNSPFSGLLS
jgi:hypothetical protein